MPGEGVRNLFRTSKDYVPVPGLFDALSVFFGLTPADHAVFNHDHISAFELRHTEGHKTSHQDASRRIIEHQRRDFSTYLNGESLRCIMNRFNLNFSKQLQRRIAKDTGTSHLSDLYKFVRDAIFEAEVEALYGERLLSLCPTFSDDFWAFYDAFPTVSRKLPRCLFRSQYEKRDKMLANFQLWRSRCHAEFDWSDDELVNSDYEPIWGSRYVRRMVQRHEKMGFSDAGVASNMLGYLFVTTANSVPAAAWMVLHTVLDKDLRDRLRHELSIEDTETPPVDLAALSSAPLLNSVYRETLRLHVASATGRASVSSGFGSHQTETVTMTANWLGGLDSTFWNEGPVANGVPQHPVGTFWAERFLVYPDDPSSGPTRPKSSIVHEVTQNGKKSMQDDSKAKLANSGLRGHWFPFGGGAWRCPGETLAKNSILASVFMLLRDYDIELVNPENAVGVTARHRHRTLPFGTHAFDRAVPISVTKR
ncbi:Cholesterol 7-alpha-monooxygenase [Colletotrichum trifolii]|uniref:Cholesterol 7-alpha-monooxygenase n=1 Tax=Colletotrichum trifolii TaxID=5466 RepID=A0A4R8RJQ8_COLTR|nr:Cholesterol 7-alpha-monooxygenase [Colletotrichum trifolii]